MKHFLKAPHTKGLGRHIPNAQYAPPNPHHIRGYYTCSFDIDLTTSDYKETTQVFYSSQDGVNPHPWMILGFR